jgi:hypothetical protein
VVVILLSVITFNANIIKRRELKQKPDAQEAEIAQAILQLATFILAPGGETKNVVYNQVLR